MIELIVSPPLLPNVGWVYQKNDAGLLNAFGGGKKFKDGKNRVVKHYTNKHPFNIITNEVLND